MTTLRKLVDGYVTATQVYKPKVEFKEGDQVVLKKRMGRSGPIVREVLVGKISAMNDKKTSATVTLPRPGGRILRTTVPVSQLRPVSEVYNRTAVQFNPAFRGLSK